MAFPVVFMRSNLAHDKGRLTPERLYQVAVRDVAEVLAFYAARPAFLPSSMELEDKTSVAARAALKSGVDLAAVSAKLARIAAVTLDGSPNEIIAVVVAMGRWAAREYSGVRGLGVVDTDL